MGEGEAAQNRRGCRRDLADYRLGRAPGHLIRRAQQRAVDLYTDEVGDDGLTPRQFAVLLGVFQNDGINQTDLVRFSGIDRSTLTDILRRLGARGLIQRRRLERDQRSNVLSVTPAGIAALENAFAAMERAQNRILEPVPAGKRAAAIELLALLAGFPEKD